MTDDSIRPAEVGPWANEKLSALEAYLNYYTTRLKNQTQWTTIYLDAFAGGGKAVLRKKRKYPTTQGELWEEAPAAEQVEFVRGSPRRALEIKYPFTSYIFIDADPARVAMLTELKTEFGGSRRITIREGAADGQIEWVLSHKPDLRRHRGVAFLDPFGAHLSWDSVKALAHTRLFEVIINFPLHMCLTRLMTKNAEIRATWRAQLDNFLPPGWYDQVYESTQNILGDEDVRKRPDHLERLLAWYREELRSAFGFVSEPRLIRNTKGGPLYYLLWAGPHQAGLKGADYIMRMGEQPAR